MMCSAGLIDSVLVTAFSFGTADLDRQVGRASAGELARVLSALVEGAQGALRDALVGVYLVGSFALGRGDGASDVDFLVVSSRELTSAQEDSARALHRRLPNRPEHWSHHLEGSWVTAAALRDPAGTHKPWLYLNHGSRTMEYSRHDDTANARWVLRQAGVALVGSPAVNLLPEVAADDVRAEAVIQADARANWIRDESGALYDGWAQPYIVLTHCRLMWSATFATVISKAEAAEWVRDKVAPAEFRNLITRSIAYRLRPFDPATNEADPSLAPVVLDFVGWATAEIHARASSTR